MIHRVPSFQSDNRLHRLIRFVVFNLVRLFYPRLDVQGLENLPANAPVIFVLNHPNGLLDPLVLMLGLGRPAAFLAKSTLFGNPVGKTLCEAFGALPVFRRQDDGLRGGPTGDAAERNEMTFARCRALLHTGGAMALFPEGTTHSDPQLRQLRSGAARIALSAEAEYDWSLGVQLVPVGLWYESKIHFRTSVLLVIGQPFALTGYAAGYAADAHQAVDTVTEQIDAGLDNVVLQAENADLLAAVPVLAAWIAPEGGGLTMAQQHEWTGKLLSAYERLRATDPARLDAIAQEARQYAATLQTLGIDNPWTLELAAVKPGQLSRLILRLGVGFPFALAGLVLSYIPYRLAGPLAIYAVGPHDTQTSTLKLILGSVFVLIAWMIEAIVVDQLFGGGWGVLLFVAAPPLAYIALRWGEDWRKLREVVSSRWLRLRRGELVQSLVAQRQILTQQVLDAVQEIDR